MSARFSIYYTLTASSHADALALADWISLEQSAELPPGAISAEHRERWCGRIEALKQSSESTWNATLSFPAAIAGPGISQFLNVLFGNISIGAGILVTGIDWHALPGFDGPRFGIPGVRAALGIYGRPVSCTALKPVGSNPAALGKACFQFARGGIDIIKDDHGLANQPMADFAERLKACSIATKRAFEETGMLSRYFPNITADGPELFERFEAAADAGCTGVLVSPHLIGPDRLTALRRHPAGLMLMAHPAFSGTLTGNPAHGLTHRFLYGELWRALGADFSIYPNTGGRFPYTPEICASINAGCRDTSLPFRTSFPTPGGGINAAKIPHWKTLYGNDTVFLIGGSLYSNPDGLETASRDFTQSLRA